MEQEFTHVLFFVLFFLATLGIEPRASDMLGKCSATELHPENPSPQVFMNEAAQVG